nr:tetratricopeptide repeat protein [Treponema sp.]
MKDNLRKTLCMAFAALVLSGSAFSADAKKTKADREAARERERERVERKAAADRQDAYEEAVEAFQLNKPAEAIPLLEAFLGDEKHDAYNPDVYVYLSAAYYQIEEYQKSIDVCELGLSKEGTNYKVLYFNEGNAAYALGQYMKAASLYEKSRGVDSQYAPATLNLANAFLRQDKIEEARDDYVLYLELKPDTPQRPEIERLIALLNEEIDYRKRLGPELVQDLLRTSADDGSEGPHELMSDSEAAAPGLPLERVNKYGGEQLDTSESQAPALPVENRSQRYSGEQLDSSESQAPALPVENRSQRYRGEQLDSSESQAPALPVERRSQNSGEQLDTSESQAPALPVERRKQNSGEQLDSSESQAPALPVERRKRNSGEQVNSSDSQAPSLPKSGDSKRKGEYIDNPSAPALPEESKAEAKKEERMSTSDTVAPKMPEEKKKSAGEKIKDNAPALPKEKKDERLERIKNQDAPKLPAEENEAVVSEEKNSASESASSVDAK